MRRLWILRFVLTAALTVIAAINIVPLPPNLLAVSVGVVALTMLGWSEIEHRQRLRDSPLFAKHIEEIQGFAINTRTAVASHNLAYLNEPLGRSFRRHYRHIADRLDTWGQRDRYQQTNLAFHLYLAKESRRVFPEQEDGFASLLHHVAENNDLSTLTWTVDGTRQLVARIDGDGDVPGPKAASFPSNAGGRLIDMWESLVAVERSPVVREWMEQDRMYKRRQKQLMDDLETIRLRHSLDGTCDLCKDMR
jgi:hypothetical protein